MENEQDPPPPPPPMPSSNDHVVIVHGLSSSVSEEAIRRFFSRILMDPIQQLTIDRSTGTAALHLAHAEDVEEALTVIDAPLIDTTTTDAEGDAPSSDTSSSVLIRVTLPGAAPHNDPPHHHHHNNNNNHNAGPANEAQLFHTAASTTTTLTSAGLPEALKVVVRDIPNVGNAADGLRQLFSECGELRDVSLDPRRPIAYLTFCDAAGVEAALQREGVEWNGAVLHVERKRLPPSRQSRLVVKYLPETALSEEGVRGLFGDCGELHDIFVNAEKRIAFIAFLDEASAEKALAKNGVVPPAERKTPPVGDGEDGGDGEGAAAVPLVVERRERQKCFKCNREGHLAVDCRSSAVVCRECGRPGHIARDCRSARHHHQGGPSSFRGGPPSASHSHSRFNGGRGGGFAPARRPVGGFGGAPRGGFGGAGPSSDRRRYDGPSSRGYGDDGPRDVGRRRRRSFSDDRDDRRRRRRSSSPRRTRRSRSRSPPRRSPRRSRSPRRRRSRTPPARR